jgi:hypothetical protein
MFEGSRKKSYMPIPAMSISWNGERISPPENLGLYRVPACYKPSLNNLINEQQGRSKLLMQVELYTKTKLVTFCALMNPWIVFPEFFRMHVKPKERTLVP